MADPVVVEAAIQSASAAASSCTAGAAKTYACAVSSMTSQFAGLAIVVMKIGIVMAALICSIVAVALVLEWIKPDWEKQRRRSEYEKWKSDIKKEYGSLTEYNRYKKWEEEKYGGWSGDDDVDWSVINESRSAKSYSDDDWADDFAKNNRDAW